MIMIPDVFLFMITSTYARSEDWQPGTQDATEGLAACVRGSTRHL